MFTQVLFGFRWIPFKVNHGLVLSCLVANARVSCGGAFTLTLALELVQ
jgi:hypothetical protein